ncbi:hypothetical protein BsWGS_03469 [Bradybaena similaris]
MSELTLASLHLMLLIFSYLEGSHAHYVKALNLNFLCTPLETGMFVRDVPWDCSSYVICISGLAVPATCPMGKLYMSTQINSKCGSAAEVNPARCVGTIWQYIREICRHNPTATVPDAAQCSHYFDCSLGEGGREYMDYLLECPYPTLYSTQTGSCKDYRFISCEERTEPRSPCEYQQYLQKYNCSDPSCAACHRQHPSCVGLPNGPQRLSHRDDILIVCQDQRTISIIPAADERTSPETTASPSVESPSSAVRSTTIESPSAYVRSTTMENHIFDAISTTMESPSSDVSSTTIENPSIRFSSNINLFMEGPRAAVRGTITEGPSSPVSSTTMESSISNASSTTMENSSSNASSTTIESSSSNASSTTIESSSSHASSTTMKNPSSAVSLTTMKSPSSAVYSTTMESISSAVTSTTMESLSSTVSSTTIESISSNVSSTTMENLNSTVSSTTIESLSSTVSSTTMESLSSTVSSTTMESLSSTVSSTTIESHSSAVSSTIIESLKPSDRPTDPSSTVKIIVKSPSSNTELIGPDLTVE